MTELVVHDNPQTDAEIPILELGVEQLNSRLTDLNQELQVVNSDVAKARATLESFPTVEPVVKRIRDLEHKINTLSAVRSKAKQKLRESMKTYDESSSSTDSQTEKAETEEVPGKLKVRRDSEKLDKEVKILGRRLRNLTHPDKQKDKEIVSFFSQVAAAIKTKDLRALQDLEAVIVALVASSKSAKERKLRIVAYTAKLRSRVNVAFEELALAKSSVTYSLAQMLKQGKTKQAEDMYTRCLIVIEQNMEDQLFELTERTRFAVKMAAG